MEKTFKGLSANTLKYIAIIAMTIDHLSWAFFPKSSFIGQAMHCIGRITAPLMCYFIAEGFHYTKDVKKYALRLALFALISQIPFGFFFNKGQIIVFPLIENHLNMIFSLLLGLLSLIIWNNDSIKKPLKILSIIVLCLLSHFCDWQISSVLYIFTFGIFFKDLKNQIKWFTIITAVILVYMSVTCQFSGVNLREQWYQIGIFLALPLICLYNGTRGKGGKFNKWVFYIFYPLHLLILGLINYYI